MTVELSLLLSGISVASAVFFGITSKSRYVRIDTEQETEDRTATHTILMENLKHIEDTVKEIKDDSKELKGEVRELRDRVIAVEQSLKSYHKRLDGMKTDQ